MRKFYCDVCSRYIGHDQPNVGARRRRRRYRPLTRRYFNPGDWLAGTPLARANHFCGKCVELGRSALLVALKRRRRS